MARRIGPAIPDELLAGGDAAAALNSRDIVNALKKRSGTALNIPAAYLPSPY